MPPPTDPVTERMHSTRDGLAALLSEAAAARVARAETGPDGQVCADGRICADGGGGTRNGSGASAVCAWNHFENIPTFYNWNNRPR